MKVVEDSEGRKVEARRKPLGVIGAIVPWNFPLMLMAFKVPAALLAGQHGGAETRGDDAAGDAAAVRIDRRSVPPGVLERSSPTPTIWAES